MKKINLLLTCLIFSNFIIAQNREVTILKKMPIITDRPDQTESPYVVPLRHWQFEIGSLMEVDKVNSKLENRFMMYPTILSKVGITKNLELRLITEFASEKTFFDNRIINEGSGIRPVIVGFKAALFEEKKLRPKTSFIGHLGLSPLASKQFKPNNFYPQFRFLMQHTLTSKLNFGYNLGMEWDGSSSTATGIYTASFAYSLSDRMGAFIESYGYLPQHLLADHRLDGGITYLIRNNMQFDVSSGIGISENAPDYFISGGFSFRIPN